MGAAMVENLQNKGYPLTVMANRSRQAVDHAVSRGAQEVSTAKEVAENADVIMLCMDTSESVESRMFGEQGVIAGLSEGKVVIDFGTSLPDSTRKLGAAVSDMNAHMLDAPLGRTPAHAKDGLLNIMASGDKSAYDKVENVLQDLGENVFYLGDLGTGHTIKLINNFFGMTCASAMAEAFSVAEKSGIDSKKLYDVMSSGPLHSGMMDFVAAYAVDNDPNKLEFSINNACKDITYYSSMVEEMGRTLSISSATRSALNSAIDSGFGDKHVSEIVEHFRQS